MKLLPILVLVLVVLVLVAGCSSSSDAPSDFDVPAYCSKSAECGLRDASGATVTPASCVASLRGWLPPPGCLPILSAATCVGLLEDPAIRDACFPACTGTGSTCVGDRLTTCSNGRTTTFECGGYCARQNLSYVGACGVSYNGQTSPKGATCWCG